MKSEIKPCPFCGAEPEHGVGLVEFDGAWAVGCDKCGSWGPVAATEEFAIKLWNQRAGDQG